jgi:hypothetical protein
MNREDIISMAREAGGQDWGIFRDFMPEIERFATLVAEHEREACAKVCINLANRWTQMGAWGSNTEFHQCADAIRARGQA